MNNYSFRIFTAMNRNSKTGMSRKLNKENNKLDDQKKDHLVFLICLILAASFWFLIKLSDNYSVSYRLKIKYSHVPVGRLITALGDSTATIHFKSNGYNLLDLLINRKLDSLNVDLAQCDIRKDVDGEYSVTTASLRESTAQFLGVNDRDLEFSKPKLHFYMEQLHNRKMKVSALLDLNFKSQYRLYGYKITPGTVSVYGPKQILDTLKTISTDNIHLENLAGDQKVVAKIKNPYPRMLKFYPAKVQVNLDVEKYTERTIQVPVDVSEIKPVIRTFPISVTINFNVFIRDYEKVHPSHFRVIPNIKNIDLRKVKKLRLELVSQPAIISNARLVPPEVEFIIVN